MIINKQLITIMTRVALLLPLAGCSTANENKSAPAAVTSKETPAYSTPKDPPADITLKDSPAAVTPKDPPAAVTPKDPPAAVTPKDPPAAVTPKDPPADTGVSGCMDKTMKNYNELATVAGECVAYTCPALKTDEVKYRFKVASIANNKETFEQSPTPVCDDDPTFTLPLSVATIGNGRCVTGAQKFSYRYVDADRDGLWADLGAEMIDCVTDPDAFAVDHGMSLSEGTLTELTMTDGLAADYDFTTHQFIGGATAANTTIRYSEFQAADTGCNSITSENFLDLVRTSPPTQPKTKNSEGVYNYCQAASLPDGTFLTLSSSSVTICKPGSKPGVTLGTCVAQSAQSPAYIVNGNGITRCARANDTIISCAALPAPAGGWNMINPSGIAIADNMIYVTNAIPSAGAITICSIDNAGDITSCSKFDDQSFVETSGGIAISGGYAYVPNRSDTSVSVCPISGSTLGTCNSIHIGGAPSGIAISGNHIYVSNDSPEVGVSVCQIIEDSLENCTNTSTSTGSWGISVAHDKAYLVGYVSEAPIKQCSITDNSISSPSSCFEYQSGVLGDWRPDNGSQGIAIANDVAYITDYDGGFVEQCTIVAGGITSCYVPEINGEWNLSHPTVGIAIP